MPQLTDYDQAHEIELAADQASSLMQLRVQLTAINDRLVDQDNYQISCGRQVEKMRDLVSTAPESDESDRYVAHLGTLLARDELILAQALDDTEKLLRIQAELTAKVDAAFEAAGLGRVNRFDL